MISGTCVEGRENERMAGIVRGTIVESEDCRAWVRTVGGHTWQAFTKTACMC